MAQQPIRLLPQARLARKPPGSLGLVLSIHLSVISIKLRCVLRNDIRTLCEFRDADMYGTVSAGSSQYALWGTLAVLLSPVSHPVRHILRTVL
jgi:hypothetical protein